MTPERWAQIEDLFHRAIECEPDCRLHLLQHIGAADPDLRSELESLLRAYRSANFHLETAVQEAAAATCLGSGEAISARAGSHIGPYRLLQLIGEGGMGEVWLSEQQYPVRRPVALKLIRAGMDTREVVARFASERQTLAVMDHPAIARVFDAGATPGGRPYFVMEHVDGIPITEYCDRHKLTIHQRLQLFIRVCEGVQHAHQKAIIHRDLKPSNILVVDVDGKAFPRIIDFGVAKAVSEKPPNTTYTREGTVIGTPGYMSPEQAGASGEDIDTRTDVYSLGVILYELLSGSLPFDFSDIPFGEALCRLREQDAPAPSVKLRTAGVGAATIAQNRGAHFSTLIRQLRGDLDAIALKALEKRKARRYAGAAEAAADVRRYLNHEPILARTAGATYQLSKFTRRHKAPVAGACAVFAVLAAGVVVSSWEARRARRAEELAVAERNEATALEQRATRERDRARTAERTAAAEAQRATVAQQHAVRDRNRALTAERLASYERDRAVGAEAKAVDERNRALAEKQRADSVNAFLQDDLLAQAGPESQSWAEATPDRDLKVRTALDRAAIKVGARFQGQPLMEAAVRETIGNAYEELGLYQEAENELNRAIELQRPVLGEDDVETLRTMRRRAENLFRRMQRPDQAEPLLVKVVSGFRRLLGEDSPETLLAIAILGDLYRTQAKLKLAEPLLVETLYRSRRVAGEHATLTLRAENMLALLYTAQQKYAQAEALLTDAVNGFHRTPGTDAPLALLMSDNLAHAYMSDRKYSEAELLYTEVLAARQRVLGTEHPQTMETMRELAATYVQQGKYQQAGILYKKTLALEQRVLGEDDVQTIRTGNFLARWYFDQGMYPEAEQLGMNTLQKSSRVLGSENVITARNVGLLGELRVEQRRHAEGETLLREALRVFTKFNVPDPLTRYEWESALGASLAGQNREAEAESLLTSAYQKMGRLDSRSTYTQFLFKRASMRIVRFYSDRAQPEKAAEWQREMDLRSK